MGGCLFLPLITYCMPCIRTTANLKKEDGRKKRERGCRPVPLREFALDFGLRFFLQFYIVNIPFIAIYCCRERLAKKMGFCFFWTPRGLVPNTKISPPRKRTRNLGAQEKKPNFRVVPPREARRLPKLCLKNRTPNRPAPARPGRRIPQ